MKGNSSSTKRIDPYEVNAKGSLGLLAMGAEGLRLWRQKKQQFTNTKPSANQ